MKALIGKKGCQFANNGSRKQYTPLEHSYL